MFVWSLVISDVLVLWCDCDVSEVIDPSAHAQLVGHRQLYQRFSLHGRLRHEWSASDALRWKTWLSWASVIGDVVLGATEAASEIATCPSVIAVCWTTTAYPQGSLRRCQSGMTKFRHVQARFSRSTAAPNACLRSMHAASPKTNSAVHVSETAARSDHRRSAASACCWQKNRRAQWFD